MWKKFCRIDYQLARTSISPVCIYSLLPVEMKKTEKEFILEKNEKNVTLNFHFSPKKNNQENSESVAAKFQRDRVSVDAASRNGEPRRIK